MDPPLSCSGAADTDLAFTLLKKPANWNRIADGFKVILSVEDVGDDLGLLAIAVWPVAPVVDVAIQWHDNWRVV